MYDMRANRSVRFFIAQTKKLPQLTLKEKGVVIARLKRKTLDTIGLKYGVTEGRIRQIEKSALNKFKSKLYQLKLFNE